MKMNTSTMSVIHSVDTSASTMTAQFQFDSGQERRGRGVEKSAAAGECARRKSSGEGTAADSNESGCKWLRPDRALLNLLHCTGSCSCSIRNGVRIRATHAGSTLRSLHAGRYEFASNVCIGVHTRALAPRVPPTVPCPSAAAAEERHAAQQPPKNTAKANESLHHNFAHNARK